MTWVRVSNSFYLSALTDGRVWVGRGGHDLAAAGSLWQKNCCLVQTSLYHTALHAGMVRFRHEELWISPPEHWKARSREKEVFSTSSDAAAAAMGGIPDFSSGIWGLFPHQHQFSSSLSSSVEEACKGFFKFALVVRIQKRKIFPKWTLDVRIIQETT